MSISIDATRTFKPGDRVQATVSFDRPFDNLNSVVVHFAGPQPASGNQFDLVANPTTGSAYLASGLIGQECKAGAYKVTQIMVNLQSGQEIYSDPDPDFTLQVAPKDLPKFKDIALQ
ncbi:MAG: hypothetical protein M3Z37_11760 [Candidatus Eremiobacteraeota bacterium]|nr:hypothetical protein [Candidatus Eremiobacteraeota bacterium]